MSIAKRILCMLIRKYLIISGRSHRFILVITQFLPVLKNRPSIGT